ncbi:hypothetical protein DEV91_1586 [Phyllobacterium brassicacearum]|nr:hypothetical protein DEV91_1586 [Phyllobacterium brassicacearum]
MLLLRAWRFVEASKEAGIFVETIPRPPATGRPDPKWGKRKTTLARDCRPKQPWNAKEPHEQELHYDFGTLSTDSGFTMTINAGGRYDFRSAIAATILLAGTAVAAAQTVVVTPEQETVVREM